MSPTLIVNPMIMPRIAKLNNLKDNLIFDVWIEYEARLINSPIRQIFGRRNKIPHPIITPAHIIYHPLCFVMDKKINNTAKREIKLEV